MTRSSPSVQRVVAVLNFVADHPDQSFTLTDLVRALKLSRATCHGLLTGLVEAGYLFRRADKSYVLGPALLAIGRNADSLLSPLQAAQPEMRVLADEFDVVCSAVFRDDDALIVRERAASRSHLGWATPRDTRLPLRPPYAGMFLAWLSAAEAEAWMDTLEPPVPPEHLETMRSAMEFTRAHGYSAVIMASSNPGPSLADMAYGPPGGEAPITFTDRHDPEALYHLRSVSAPVFDSQRRVSFTLSLVGFGAMVEGAQIRRIGETLRASCDRITAYIGGRKATA